MASGQSDPGGIILRRWQQEALPLTIAALRRRERPVVSAFMGAGKSVFLAELISQSKEQPGRGVVVAAPRANLVVQLAETLRRRLGAEAVGCWYEAQKIGDRRVTVSTYQSLPTLAAAWQASGRSPSLLVCDEAHRTEADGVQYAIARLEALAGGRWVSRVGLTATPFRSDKRESLSMWDNVVYRYTSRQGVADKVIVPARVVRWDGKDGADAVEVDQICTDMLIAADVWPTLASANTIDNAESFAMFLRTADIPAAAVHSRLSSQEVEARIEALKGGVLKVLVHVSMLSEGADFPWLRGLMVRRRVAARVRFVQEVGRVLRAEPGKTEGVVFDPFDLMTELGMTHDDAIGKVLDGEDEDEDEDEGADEEEDEEEKEEKEKTTHNAVLVMPISGWLTDVYTALEPHGLEARRGGSWRRGMPTEAQIRTARGMAGWLKWWRGDERIPALLKEWTAGNRITRRGDASDLIGLFRWLSERSAPTRALMKAGVLRAEEEYQWPDVILPEHIPTIIEDEMSQKIAVMAPQVWSVRAPQVWGDRAAPGVSSVRAEQEAAVEALQVWLDGGGR